MLLTCFRASAKRNYGAFIIAARNAGWDTIKGKCYRIAEEKQIEDFSNLRQAKVVELSRKKGRPPVLKRKLLAHRGEIVEMMEKGHSYRTIADFLKKHRKIKTSPSNLYKLLKESQTND
jgi:DNA-binding NarL/FixJ family response regulator